jgi:hypothetical protein
MPDYEIQFHRYFSRLPHPDRVCYKGRLELDRFEPRDMSEALASIRDQINGRFETNMQRVVTPSGSTLLYMDYVESDVINALAFQSNGIYFIGITSRMLQHFIETCSALWRLNPLAELLGITLDGPNRNFLFQILLLLQIQFIADHELGHMFHGHCENLSTASFYEEFDTNASNGISGTDGLHDQAHEVEADGYAVEMMLHGLFRDGVGRFVIERLRPSIDGDEFLLLLYVLAVGAVLYWLPASDFDPSMIRISKHPRGIVRMNIIMQDVWRWCQENNAALIEFVSPERFQWVLACVQTAADNPQQQTAWLAQGSFLKSADGQAYMDELYAIRESLREKMNSHQWRSRGLNGDAEASDEGREQVGGRQP